MQDLLSVLFYVRKNKSKSDTHAKAYLRITYNGKRVELSTMRNVPLDKWNAKGNKVSGSSMEAKQINRHLDIIRNRIYEVYQRFLNNGEAISAVKIRDEYLGIAKVKKSILEMFEEHNNRMGKLVGKEFSFRTLQRYQTTKKHLFDFISLNYKLEDYPVKDIDTNFINCFIYYLKIEKDLSHNSAVKYLAYLKKIVRVAFANGWMEKDPFYNFKLKVHPVDRDFLTREELIRIMEKEFNIPRIEHVRDVFLFCCYTGLAYVDVEKLNANHIVKGIDGNLWIKLKRTKTKTLSSIPLLPVAEKLLEKYVDYEGIGDSEGRLLPVYSNQRTNGYLKEIADRCGIKKHLTFHVARHTFATTVTLSNGVPIESVSKMLGHRSLKITQHYAKILDEKLSEDMNTLKKRIAASEEDVSIKLKRK
ncbi:site-specific integrase [Autumnicola musiva]|uniref:Site-specific integrase n=1 Tax=Autumnicola musiva TaxID=3075589 RepID=A0ABU3D511_9FLAO|nr:site-specific integrase [Zunongwangia sp. F117]MDT0676584.1 site-specific integrase [Zunongwangia sp. F117]